MTDKPEWMADAMREIIDLVCDQSFLFRSDVRQMLTEKAVVIIDGHCPEDKSGELVEALQELLTSIEEDWGISERYKAHRKAKAALAEYESDVKHTATEDKGVGKVIETAKHMVEIAVEDSPDYWLDGIENLEAALAEHEELNK